jgi:serpin B
MPFISKVLGMRSLTRLRQRMIYSTFLAQFKNHPCPPQRNNTFRLLKNLKVLKLPYHQGGDKRKFSMFILLPEAHDGLWKLAKRLSTEPGFIEKHTPQKNVEVRWFKLLKFKISFGFEATKLLKDLGLQLPFSTEANLSEMVDSPVEQNLCVSSVNHNSFIEVNEEGTEAAAATSIVVATFSMP